jgi:hypothetical protein
MDKALLCESIFRPLLTQALVVVRAFGHRPPTHAHVATLVALPAQLRARLWHRLAGDGVSAGVHTPTVERQARPEERRVADVAEQNSNT